MDISSRKLWASCALVACAGSAFANHPVLVEGNCLIPPAGTATPPGVAGATCGDYDGDGVIGSLEDEDGDRVFGTLAGAIGENGVNQNGTITVVTSGVFAEGLSITGNVTLEAAPGVIANLDAVLQGDPGSGPRQGGVGININAPSNRQVVIRNIISRNWADGIRVSGDSRVMLDAVKIEHNINFGIVATDNAAVSIIDSRVTSTGFRVNPGTGDFPSTESAPTPGDGISFQGSSSGIINSSIVTGSFRFGVDNATGNADALFIRESSAFDNGDDFSDGVNFSRFR